LGKKRFESKFHGLLAVNKPQGMISKDVSRWLADKLGRLKLGHVGTLDPLAEGVLPILFGKATRLQDYLLDFKKTYEVTAKFGSQTTTLDSEGEVERSAPYHHVTIEMLEKAAKTMLGSIEQVPPIYSAVKYKGKALYDYARNGQADQVPLEELKRTVTIDRIKLHEYTDGVLRFDVTCHRGTYIRTLVKDIADKVDSCATLTKLIRTNASGIDVANAVSLDEIEQNIDEFQSLLVPVEDIDLGMERWRAEDEASQERLATGSQISVDAVSFIAGFAGAEASLPGGWAKPLVLLDKNGKAFGLGTAKNDGSGRITVNMKRGL